ncbi:MAG TPA: sugar phosphate isomerase/epimerase family protein [Armatimonadota bacterium]|jgi:sugar phosphate isomerase/epimerase
MSDTKLKLGVMVYAAEDPVEPIARVRELDLPSCQIGWPAFGTVEHGRRVREAADQAGVEITTLWAGLPGRAVWNFTQGPITIGLVPPETRQVRVDALEAAARVAAEIGVPSITTHVGFLPEYPYDPLFLGTLEALRQVAATCQQCGVSFWFETGQETPITLLRTIQLIGTENLGINLDPANLLVYGKANPVDALDVFGEWVRGVHAKDGEYPTGGDNLGEERPLGEGRVNFPVLIPKLKAQGFTGALTIEREISGPQQVADIRAAVSLLTPLL